MLLACRGEPEPTDTSQDTDAADTDTDPPGPDDWGVVDGCDAARTDGFGDWYDAGSAVLVHGTTSEDLALAEQVVAWYSQWVDLELDVPDAEAEVIELKIPEPNFGAFVWGAASATLWMAPATAPVSSLHPAGWRPLEALVLV